MTRDEIIKLAREAGVAQHGLGYTAWEGQLERFAALVAQHEREAVLDLVDAFAKNNTDLAAAIRARKDKQ